MIKLIHTPSEYLIALPYEERSRAKQIQNYRWDPKEKLWRYPRNEKTLLAIMMEFGPDETEVEFRKILPEDADKDIESLVASLEGDVVRQRDILDQKAELIAAHKDNIKKSEELIALSEILIEQKQVFIDLFCEAQKYGFPEDGELEGLVHFTKAAYEGNYKHADLAVELATTRAKLDVANKQIAKLRRSTESPGGDGFRTTLLHEAWGEESMPQVLRDFSFDARGAIDLQNYLSTFLSKELKKGAQRSPFADLIREAQDAGVLSDSAARVAHTLRIQRNFFAHECVSTSEVLPRASLCLYSFIIVYRELLGGRGDR